MFYVGVWAIEDRKSKRLERGNRFYFTLVFGSYIHSHLHFFPTSFLWINFNYITSIHIFDSFLPVAFY